MFMINFITQFIKTTVMQIKFYLLPVVIISLTQGCSFSASSDSSSGSSTSFSDSTTSISDSVNSIVSSPSSSSEDDENNYEVQVMNYTSAYLSTAEFDRYAFSKGIAEIANSHGVTSWEDDEATLKGIGRALKKSGMTNKVYETYKKNLANSNKTRMKIIQEGYNSQ